MASQIRRRILLVVGLAAPPALAIPVPAAGQQAPAVRHYTISELSAVPGTRTVCLGRRDHSVRMVGCFDVYRLDTGNFYDTAKKAEVRQFVWKYTAESQPGNRWLTTLAGGVSSEAGTTYDWGPGATIPIEQPVTVTAAITRDLLPQHVPGREAPGIATETDGWDFQPLPGRIDPRLTDNLFSVMWSAAKGKKPPAGEPAQVAGATIWGLVEPAPDVMPTHLRVEAHYR